MAQLADIVRLDVDVNTTRARAELGKLETTAKGTATKSAKSFDTFSTSVTKLRNILYLGGATALAVGGVRALDQFVKRAERIQSMSRAFETLTARIGETSTAMLAALRPATRGLISDMELMRLANEAIILGLPVTADSMAKLSENAVKLGRAMGVDATRAMESVITGIGRQSRLWLDNIGIVVRVDEANRAYAKTLGVQVSELSDAQKKLAFYNATVEAADEASRGLTDTVNDKVSAWNRLGVEIENTTNKLIEYLSTGETVPYERLRYGRNKGGAMLAGQRFQNWQLRQGSLGGMVGATGAQPGYENIYGVTPPMDPVDKVRASVAELYRKQIQATHDAYYENIGRDRISPVGPGATGMELNLPPGTSDFADLTGPGPDFTALEEEKQQELLDLRIRYAERYSEAWEELELERLTNQYDFEIEQAEQIGMDTSAIKEKYELQKNAIEQQASKARISMAQQEAYAKIAYWSSVSGAAGSAIVSMFGQSKKYRVAEAIISTLAATVTALANPPFPPYSIPQAAAAFAMGMARVQAIKGTSLGGGGGAGGGLGGGFSSVGQTPQQGGARAVEVKVFVEGGFVSNVDDLTREIATGLEQQMSRAGV